MPTQWLGKFADALKEIITFPCYLIFVFIGAILLLVSLIVKYQFQSVWIFFIYSSIGLVWRYIEKDMLAGIQKLIEKDKNKYIVNLICISIYHIGNIFLLCMLYGYLKKLF